MRSSYLIFITGFCLVFAAACGDDDGGGTGGAGGGTGGAGGGTGGTGGTGGAVVTECGDPEGGPLFDFSAAVFKPYNSLLDEMTGTGNFLTDCAAPDLSGNPGANLTGVGTQCLILTPPDISGCMQFDETSPGNFDVTGEQTLSFVIDVTVASVFARVVITTDSVTEFSGTGTGSLPGTITLDSLGDGFNINASATGNVNCQATNTATNEDVSDTVCLLANLPSGGDNSVPLPGDPGTRTFPPFTIGASTFEFGSGPADPTGWYLSNPRDIAGNGTQWIALAGDQTNAGAGGSGGQGGSGGGS